jgi:predicted MFS family arabinose efflux permease
VTTPETPPEAAPAARPPEASPPPEATKAESRLLLVIAAVQFVNILDFMMVMPLGPDFARELGIAPAHLGVIGGSYTAAAAISGILCSTFLDRFDRRRALLVAMAGLGVGTALGALSWSLPSLLAARVLAGVFGGPATALSLSIVADAVPASRRGRAMGVVMGAFSIASVLGVPAGLELATLGGWRLPFFVVAGLGLAVLVAAATLLPPMRGHIGRGGPVTPLRELVGRRTVVACLAATGVMNAAGFALIPNISPFLLMNVGYPREHLGLLYMLGGATSFVCLRIAGPLVDRYGSFVLFAAGSLLLAFIVPLGFYSDHPFIPAVLLFPLMMGSMSVRNVAFQSLSSLIPGPDERARFQSAQSAVQHLAAAAGAMISSLLLDAAVTDRLEGMERIVVFTVALSLSLLPVVGWLTGAVSRSRAALSPPAGPGAPPRAG